MSRRTLSAARPRSRGVRLRSARHRTSIPAGACLWARRPTPVTQRGESRDWMESKNVLANEPCATSPARRIARRRRQLPWPRRTGTRSSRGRSTPAAPRAAFYRSPGARTRPREASTSATRFLTFLPTCRRRRRPRQETRVSPVPPPRRRQRQWKERSLMAATPPTQRRCAVCLRSRSQHRRRCGQSLAERGARKAPPSTSNAPQRWKPPWASMALFCRVSRMKRWPKRGSMRTS